MGSQSDLEMLLSDDEVSFAERNTFAERVADHFKKLNLRLDTADAQRTAAKEQKRAEEVAANAQKRPVSSLVQLRDAMKTADRPPSPPLSEQQRQERARAEEKKRLKRAANRRSACTSRVRKKQFVEEMTALSTIP